MTPNQQEQRLRPYQTPLGYRPTIFRAWHEMLNYMRKREPREGAFTYLHRTEGKQ